MRSRGLEVRLRPTPAPFLKGVAKRLALRWVPTTLYRRPVSSLRPERLYAYLDALWERRELEGAVVEIGCYLGGTAAIATQMLKRTGFPKRYVCVDTFSGFVDGHFQEDVSLGTSVTHRRSFADNSLVAVKRLLAYYGSEEVELIAGDICEFDASALPEQISVCLIDVDLEAPTYAALKVVWPRIVPDGVILVDDCGGDEYAGAAIAYRRFIEAEGLAESYFMGMGIAERTVPPEPLTRS
jgi:predicted O-methyltransferase YrrM